MAYPTVVGNTIDHFYQKLRLIKIEFRAACVFTHTTPRPKQTERGNTTAYESANDPELVADEVFVFQ